MLFRRRARHDATRHGHPCRGGSRPVSVLLIGDRGTGKTTFTHTLLRDSDGSGDRPGDYPDIRFPPPRAIRRPRTPVAACTAAGVDCHHMSHVPWLASQPTSLRIWDSTGDPASRPLVRRYLPSADVVIVFHDADIRHACASLDTHVCDVLEHATPDTVLLMVGTTHPCGGRGPDTRAPRGSRCPMYHDVTTMTIAPGNRDDARTVLCVAMAELASVRHPVADARSRLLPGHGDRRPGRSTRGRCLARLLLCCFLRGDDGGWQGRAAGTALS